MPDESDGRPAAGGGNPIVTPNNRATPRGRDGAAHFKGETEELGDSIYHVAGAHGSDSFAQVTEKIARYVSKTFANAGEYRTALPDLTLPPLPEPTRRKIGGR